MKLRPIAAIVLRQLYLLRQSPVRIFGLVVWVTIDIVLWGFITRYLNTVSGSGVNFVPTLLGAVLLWDFSERIMQGVSTAFLEDVWSRNFLNLFSSPLSISEYITGLVITSMLTSCLGLVAMLVVATAVFHLQFFSLGVSLAAFILVLFVFGISLGILATRHGAAVRTRRGVAALAAARAALTLRRGVLSARHLAGLDAGRCAGVAAVIRLRGNARVSWPEEHSPRGCYSRGARWPAELLAVVYFYARVYRRAVRTGLLARYSAEGTA